MRDFAEWVNRAKSCNLPKSLVSLNVHDDMLFPRAGFKQNLKRGQWGETFNMIFRFSEVKCTFLLVQKVTIQGKWPLSLLLLWPGVISYCWKLSNVRRFQPSRQNRTIFVHVGDSYIQRCRLFSFGWYTKVVCRFEIVFLLCSQGSILLLGMFLKQQRFSSWSWCTMFWEMSKSSVKLTWEKSVWIFHIWATQILQIAVFNSVVASHYMIKILLLQNCLVIFSSYLCNNRDILHTKHCSWFESHVTWFNWKECGNLKLSRNIMLFQLYKILQGHAIYTKNLLLLYRISHCMYLFS